MYHLVATTVMDRATDSIVESGTAVTDFRGECWELVSGSDVTTQGRAGKVHVRQHVCDNGNYGYVDRWFYASSFGLYVVGLMSCGCPVGPDHGGHLDSCTEV